MITLNGDPLTNFIVDADTTVASLLDHLGVAGGQKGIAVAINDEVVPRSQWSTHLIVDGDRIELIRATQGG